MEPSENSLNELIRNSSWRVRISAILLICMSVLPFITSVASITLFATYIEEIKQWDAQTLLIAGVVLFFTCSFSITSTTLLSIGAAYLFGWQAYPVLLAMFVAGSVFGYFIANWFDKGTIMDWIKKNKTTYEYLEKLKEREGLMVFIMRLTPSLPFTVTNIFCSYINIPLKKYLFFGVIGIGLRLIATVYTGTRISSLTNLYDDPSYWYQNITFVIVSMLLFGILYYLIMKDTTKTEQS